MGPMSEYNLCKAEMPALGSDWVTIGAVSESLLGVGFSGNTGPMPKLSAQMVLCTDIVECRVSILGITIMT